MSLPLKVATACFLRKNGKTLFIDYTALVSHPIHAGKYAPPGGKLEERESLEQCVIREVREETGIVAKNVIYKGKVTFMNEKRTINGKPMKYNWEVHFYDCKDFNDLNARPNEGELKWKKDEDVLSFPLHEGDRIVWGWMQRYNNFVGEITHENEFLTRANLLSYE